MKSAGSQSRPGSQGLAQGEKYVGRSFMLSFIFPVSEYVRRILKVERRLGGLLNKSSFQYLFVWVSSSG